MPALEVLLMGISTNHARDFVAHRPNGMGCYLITCFETPFSTLTTQGWQNGHPGDCMIISPDFPEHHCATAEMETGFVNDWIHVTGSGVPELLSRYQLPCNTIIHTGTAGLLTPELSVLQSELYEKKQFYAERIALLFEMLLLKIARSAAKSEPTTRLTPQEARYLPHFLKLRQTMYHNATANWTIKALSAMVNLSESRFSFLYQKFFHISPYEDLMKQRIESAQRALLYSGDKISEVAEKCGFSNMFYFSRVFKKHVGCTPSDYRKGNQRAKITKGL